MTIKYVIDNDIEKYANEKTLELLRNMFWENKDRSLLFNGNTSHTHVAIHIRRPNQYDMYSFTDKKISNQEYYKRFGTPNEYYINIINKIRDEYYNVDSQPIVNSQSLDFKSNIPCENLNSKKPLLFHIYSQGEDNSLFNSFIADDIVLHINSDVFLSFTEMVAADMLITSFSSFSYTAAILNSGTIYYHPFWHTPMKNWNKLAELPAEDTIN